MNTPYIEKDCTIEHDGRTFTSGGAVVTDEYVIGYVGKSQGDGMGLDRTGPTSTRHLLDWHGNRIGGCFLASSWRIPNGWMSSRMYQIYATVNGRRYTGRGMGEGMICRLRLCARDALAKARGE